jgi:hypothetical protein
MIRMAGSAGWSSLHSSESFPGAFARLSLELLSDQFEDGPGSRTLSIDDCDPPVAVDVDGVVPRVQGYEPSSLLCSRPLRPAGFLPHNDDPERPTLDPQVEALPNVAHDPFPERVSGPAGAATLSEMRADERLFPEQMARDVAAEQSDPLLGGSRVDLHRSCSWHASQVLIVRGPVAAPVPTLRAEECPPSVRRPQQRTPSERESGAPTSLQLGDLAPTSTAGWSSLHA